MVDEHGGARDKLERAARKHARSGRNDVGPLGQQLGVHAPSLLDAAEELRGALVVGVVEDLLGLALLNHHAALHELSQLIATLHINFFVKHNR